MADDAQQQLSAYKEITEFASKHISESRESFERYYKLTMTGLLFIATVTIGIFYWFIGKEYKDIAASVQSKADTHFAQLDNEIRQRISAQFEDKRMRTLIEQVAVEQTKKGLSDVINDAVTKSVAARVKAEEPQIHETVIAETKKGVQALSPVIDAAVSKEAKLAEDRLQAHIAQYEQVIRVGNLALLARNGDGNSFDTLMKVASNSADPSIGSIAVTTRNQLYLEYDAQATGIYQIRQFTQPKKPEELIQLLSDQNPLVRKAAVDSLVAAGDKAAVPRLIPIMEHDSFIMLRIAAYRGLTVLTGEKIEPLDAEAWKTWWEKNKSNWPAK